MSRGLARYVLKRLGFAGLMLAGVSVVLFTLMRLAPGGPEAVLIGGEFSQEVAAQVRERLGLDRPLPAQYGTWVLAALRGDLGRSFKTGDPVLSLILDRLGPTLQLTGGALLPARIACPTLVMVGRHDWICPVDQAEEIHKLIPHSELGIFETSGHSPQVEERDAFTRRLGAFLGR
jgi:peptide/nickel transport system permease protein